MGEWINRTSKGFVGGVASGRGVNVTAEDDTVTITADRDLPRGKVDLAIASGFDDKSVDGLTFLEGAKAATKQNLNAVARAMIEPDEQWTERASQPRTAAREGR